jgi:tetratricopeptide (TPR) repeat protein
MIRKTSQEESALSEYIGLLVELHELTVAGQDESDTADELRDRMDAPWRSLDASEVALADGLSADLYTLGTEREAPSEYTGEAEEFERYKRAIEEGRWDRALEAVRESEQHLPPRLVAFLRGVCWAHLNQPEVAILFLEEAGRKQPLDAEEEVWLLSCMTEAGRSVESMPRVREILGSATDPLLLLQASIVFFDAAIQETGDTVVSQLREAVHAAERALDIAARAPSSDSLDSMRCSVLLHLAITYDQFGERDAAIEACRRALELDPERQTALTMLGFLSFDQYSDSQRASLRHRFHRELAADAPREVGLALMN